MKNQCVNHYQQWSKLNVKEMTKRPRCSWGGCLHRATRSDLSGGSNIEGVVAAEEQAFQEKKQWEHDHHTVTGNE